MKWAAFDDSKAMTQKAVLTPVSLFHHLFELGWCSFFFFFYHLISYTNKTEMLDVKKSGRKKEEREQ